MAEVNLRNLWIHETSDLETFKRFDYYQLSPRRSADGSRVDRLINGDFVAIEVSGVRKQWSLALRFVARSDAAWLRARIGNTLYFRTAHGDTFFGQLQDVSEQELQQPYTNPDDSEVANIALFVTEVSLSEAV